MKKMMILVSAIMMVATANAKNVATTPFEEVKVNVPARVRLVSGDSYEMGVRSTDSITENNICWTVEKGVLRISSRFEDNSESMSDVCITIVSPKEPKLVVGRDYEISEVANKKTETK